MVYSQLYFRNKNYIPLPLAIVVVFLLVIFFSHLFHQSSQPSKASKKLLKRLEIVNLNYNQASIFWQTDDKTNGYIFYGENKNKINNLVFDDRDTPMKKNNFLYHLVNIKNLLPEKEYFFLIVVDNQIIKQENGEPFSFFTPKFQLENKSPTLIYGKIFQTNNLPLENAIVFLNFDQHYSFSTITKASGEWLIPLTVFYKKNDLKAKIGDFNDKVIIEILSEGGEKTIVTGKINQFSPLPQTLVIGKNYNFLFEENVLGVKNEVHLINKKNNEKAIEIIFPQEEAVIPGYRPIIKGIALPEKEIFLSLFPLEDKNKIYNARVKANKDGFWSLKFLENLIPSKYQLILQTVDEKNNDIQLTRGFRLIGNQAIEGKVLGESTPSATIIPTTVKLLSPSPSPVSFYNPTPTINLTPTTPVSGGSNIVLLSAFGVFSIVIGLKLFFSF